MKTVIGALAGAALLFGCANDRGATQEDESVVREGSYEEKAEEARRDAPTVYPDSATGGSGTEESVEAGGETWDTQSEPMGDEPHTQDEGSAEQDPDLEEGDQ